MGDPDSPPASGGRTPSKLGESEGGLGAADFSFGFGNPDSESEFGETPWLPVAGEFGLG